MIDRYLEKLELVIYYIHTINMTHMSRFPKTLKEPYGK